MNLLFCGNYKVFDGIVLAILSLVKHSKEKFNIFIFTMDLQDLNPNYKSISEEEVKVLEKILKGANKDSVITRFDLSDEIREELINSSNMKTNYTPYIFLRLFADDVKEIPDKLLYLDADIMFYNDVKELYDINVENHEYAAVRDYYGRFFFYPNYINSGMLLLNMKKVRENNLFKRTRQLVNKKRIFLPDQTALNKLTKKKLIIPSKFNSQKKLNDDTVIRHFSKTIKFFPYFHTVNIKQWDIDKVHSILQYHQFDDIYEEFYKLKKEYSNEI